MARWAKLLLFEAQAMIGRGLLLLFTLSTLPLFAQQPCEAPAAVNAAIASAANSLPYDASAEQRIAVRRKIRDQFPLDYFANRYYQDGLKARGVFTESVQEEYRALLDSHPDDPLFLTLYASARTGTKTSEAIPLLEKALGHYPDYPYALLRMAEIYSSPAFLDAAKLRANIEAFRKTCPASLSGYEQRFLTPIPDPAFTRQSATNLRKFIESRTDDESLGFYNTLWTLEFKTVTLAGQEPVRERIRQDVIRLRAMDISIHPLVLNPLQAAYQVLGDKEGTKWVEEQKQKGISAKAVKSAAKTAQEEYSEWIRNNQPRGSLSDYNEKLAKQAAEWSRKWPDDPLPRQQLFFALQSDHDASLEDTVAAAEDWLRVYEKNPTGAAPYSSIAFFYSSRNMRYSQLPDLLAKALKNLNSSGLQTNVSDLYLIPDKSFFRAQVQSRINLLENVATTYAKIKQFDRANEIVSQFGQLLKENRPSDSAPDTEKTQYAYSQTRYWSIMGTIAQGKGNKREAFDYWRNAVCTNPNEPAPPAQSWYRVQARQLWKELGEADEEFDRQMSTAEKAAPRPARPVQASTSGSQWSAMNKAVPDFQLEDGAGKTWKLADLKGKVTLINMWATWCAPCISELPYVQRLYDKVKDRKDLQVITFNVDENPGLIEPFLREHKYSFPVLPAHDFTKSLAPQLGIPRSWIITPDGVARLESVGFGMNDKWDTETLAVMDGAASPKPGGQTAKAQ